MSFDSLARHYHWMEWLLAGEKLQRCRLRWLPEVVNAKNVLLVGEGHGKFLVECVRAMPGAEITCLDASAGMLRIAQQQLARASSLGDRIHLIHASLPNWNFTPSKFDLIVTNFFFDCFPNNDLKGVISTIAQASAPGARWIVSEFHVPADGWKKVRARAILLLAYAFFRIATRLAARSLPEYTPLMANSGFRCIRREYFDWELLTSELWEAVDAK